MSGNPMDAPFLCDQCNKEYKEEDSWASADGRKFFCSEECLEIYEEKYVEP